MKNNGFVEMWDNWSKRRNRIPVCGIGADTFTC